MEALISKIETSLNSVNWKFKNIEHWRDGLFTVTPESGGSITLSVHELECEFSVQLFSTSSFISRPFTSCRINKLNEVIFLDV